MFQLKAIRKASGLSQIQLSQLANVSRFRLSLAEVGSLDLRPDEIAAVIAAIKPELDKAAAVAAELDNASEPDRRCQTRNTSGIVQRVSERTPSAKDKS